MRATQMLALATMAGGFLWPRSVDAEPLPFDLSDQPSDDPVVRDQVAHAAAAFEEGAYKEASDYYRAAMKRRPSRDLACNLGIATRLAGNLVEAAQALKLCLKDPLPDDATEEEKARRIRYEADLSVVLEQIGTIEIRTTPGAEVLIDGARAGLAPLLEEVFVMPGAHTITAQHKGDTASGSVHVKAGGRALLTLEPKSEPGPRRTPTPVVTFPVPSAGSRPLVIAGGVTTGVFLGLGLTAFIASRVVGQHAWAALHTAQTTHAHTCGLLPRSSACADAASGFETAEALQTLGLTGLVAAAAVGGGTMIYGLATAMKNGPTVTASATGGMVLWSGRW